MDLARKLQLLDQQIADAQGGAPDDFTDWRNRTDVVVRTVMGAQSLTYKRFQRVRYSPQVMYEGQDTSSYRPRGVRSVISLLDAAKLELELGQEVEDVVEIQHSEPTDDATGSRVFIVHGHDDSKKHESARFLRALTGHEPVILHEQPNRGQVLIEKFEQSAAGTGYAVVLLTGDDIGRAKAAPSDAETPRGRQNVVFEMGFFLGAFGRQRVAVLQEPGVEQPSDVQGLVYIQLDRDGAWEARLATEIEAAGIPVDWSALR
ncbi:MAG: nucleotide-binding protein [Microlunatus sp.]